MNALSRRDAIAALVLATLAPAFQRNGPSEDANGTRRRLARTALLIAETYIQEADACDRLLGVPCPNQPPIDPPF
ncbi:MAG TPA: hypothetical protein VN688_01990 [Gemmataceae bacterium]|nr:hypothetical protein [Gemmataceae bacterium]